ncbi:MAG: DUF4395 domain-containing protein [Candidatus Omnitrophota bacterium]
MNKACPISNKTINGKAARINAIITAIFIACSLIPPYRWIIILLAIDFFIRGFLNNSYSLFTILSQKITNILKMKQNIINAGPKIFAAKIGFALSLIIPIFYALNLSLLAIIFSIIFMLCAILEALFAFCIGCKIYPLVRKFKKI